jgi:hypothetical protein
MRGGFLFVRSEGGTREATNIRLFRELHAIPDVVFEAAMECLKAFSLAETVGYGSFGNAASVISTLY